MRPYNPVFERSAAWLRGLVGILGLLSAMFATSASAVPVLSVNSSSTPGTVDVFVNVEQITDLYAYQFTLTFDRSVLAAKSVTEGTFLKPAGTTFFDGGTIDNATGLVSQAFGTLIGPVAGGNGAGTLAVLRFDVLRSAFTSVALTDVLALDSALPARDIALTVQNGAFAAAVPEPGSWMMLSAGLAFVAALRRRNGRCTPDRVG